MIEARGVSYHIGDKRILDDVSLCLEQGKVTAILGPNGSGKSTLMKCLIGVLRSQEGEVCLDGQPLSAFSVEDLARRRAYLAQGHAIDFPFTVMEVVMLGRHPHMDTGQGGGHDMGARLALERTDTWHLRERLFPTLSGGEQQRVQIARVMAQVQGLNDGCLFLDEPTSALDLKHQFMVVDILAKLAREQRLAICVILHDIQLAKRFADQIALLKEGRLYANGSAAEVLDTKNVAYLYEIPEALARDIVTVTA